MRQPLMLAQDKTCTAHSACMLQVLYVTGKIEQSDVQTFLTSPHWPGAYPDTRRRACNVALNLGMYVHHISAIDPEVLLSHEGQDHLQAVWKTYGIYEADVPGGIEQALTDEQESERALQAISPHYPGKVTRVIGLGDTYDLWRALRTQSIVAYALDRWRYLPVLLLPGIDGEELRVYDPLLGTTQPTSLDWVKQFLAPTFTYYSATPIRY